MQRIGFIVLPTSPFTTFGKGKTGGGQVNLYYLLKHLPADYEITLITTPSQYRAQWKNEFQERLKIIPVTSETTLDEIIPQIQERNIQLLHGQYWESGIIGLKIKKALQIPYIQSFWTLEKIKTHYLPSYTPNPQRVKTEEELAQKAEGLVANTEFEKKDLINYYKAKASKIVVIPPAFCPDFFRPIEKQKALSKLNLDPHFKYVLFVGRMDDIKGIPLLLKAWQAVNQKEHQTRLIITGGDSKQPYFIKIQQLIHDLGLQRIVILEEAQPHHRLPYYYNAAEVTVMPSYHESFGLVAIESMACGTPVIATEVGGIPTFISNGTNGLLFEKGSRHELERILTAVLQGRVNVEALGKKALETSRNYAWPQVIHHYTNLYEKFLSRSF